MKLWGPVQFIADVALVASITATAVPAAALTTSITPTASITATALVTADLTATGSAASRILKGYRVFRDLNAGRKRAHVRRAPLVWSAIQLTQGNTAAAFAASVSSFAFVSGDLNAPAGVNRKFYKPLHGRDLDQQRKRLPQSRSPRRWGPVQVTAGPVANDTSLNGSIQATALIAAHLEGEHSARPYRQVRSLRRVAPQLRARPSWSRTWGAIATVSSIDLAATPNATATVSGALSTAIRPAASITATAATTDALSTAIPLTASISATATTTSALSTAIPLAASITGQATVNGDLVGLPAALFGNLTATATIQAIQFTTAISCAASVNATALVQGTLATPGPPAQFDGTITSTATTSGSLTTAIALATTANGIATATATTLQTSIPVNGALTATATVQGALDTAVSLGASVIATATATGDLENLTRINASIIGTATVTADLTAGPAINPAWAAHANRHLGLSELLK